MLTFQCTRCSATFQEFQKWIDHLWEAGHQNFVRKTFTKWSDEDNSKSLVLYAPSESPPPLPSQIITMFHNLDIMVDDFVCWTTVPRMFIVQLTNDEDVTRTLQLVRQQADELRISGRMIQLRRKSDVLENEWAILVGDGGSKDAVYIDLNDEESDDSIVEIMDDTTSSDAEKNGHDSDQQNGTEESRRKKRNRNPRTVKVERMEIDNQNGNGMEIGNESSSEDDEEDEDKIEIKILTTMSNYFVKKFHSKIKPEASASTTSDADNKEFLKENLKYMVKKWTDIYLGFHDKLWPTCFLMSNRIIKGRRDKSVGFESTFECTCLKSQHTDWLRKKIDKDEFEIKVKELSALLVNETQCNRRLQELRSCKRLDNKPPLLGFKCKILILYNQGANTTAEFRISNVKGKTGTRARKVEIVKELFTKLFASYEKAKIKKWCASEPETPLDTCDEWAKIIDVE